MAGNKNIVHLIRNILVIASTVLMVLVLLFQWFEVQEYGIWPHIETTVKGLFQPEPAAAAPAAPTDPAAPAAPTAPAAEQPAQP